MNERIYYVYQNNNIVIFTANVKEKILGNDERNLTNPQKR